MKKFCAVFALFHNEKHHLPIWLEYYGKNFGYENLYVIDHDTRDGSTDCLEELGVNLIYRSHNLINDNNHFMTKTLQSMQDELLKSYQYIINPDADEFLLPDPEKYKNLYHYVEEMRDSEKKVGRATGYEVLHDRHNEPAIDWNAPLLKQRKQWIHVDTYDKPIILGEVRPWSHGKHHLLDTPRTPGPDPDLILCHIHRLDYKTIWKKGNGSLWITARQNMRANAGTFIPDIVAKKFNKLFDNPNWNTHAGAKPSTPEIIPEKWKTLL